MTVPAPNIKNIVQTKTSVQIPIAEWKKLCQRLTKLEQKEKLLKQFRAGINDIKTNKVYPIEMLLK